MKPPVGRKIRESKIEDIGDHLSGYTADMCGRYSLINPDGAIHDQLGTDLLPFVVPRYNVAPMQDAPVVRMAEGRRILESRRWGLVPPWSRDPAIGSRMINARAETVASKPAFREAWLRRRCVVPADGFYEWQSRGKHLDSQPFHIHRPCRRPFVFAGLWEGAGEDAPATFTIVTTEAPGSLRHIHHRVPVILEDDAIGRWLATPAGEVPGLAGLLAPLPDGALVADPVARFVNSVGNDGPECLTPQDAGDLFG